MWPLLCSVVVARRGSVLIARCTRRCGARRWAVVDVAGVVSCVVFNAFFKSVDDLLNAGAGLARFADARGVNVIV